MRTVSEPRTVGELMTGDPVVTSVDMPLADAAAMMDFYWLRTPTRQPFESTTGRPLTRHLMTRPAVTVASDVSIEAAAQLTEDRRIHRLMVTAADRETPIGALSVSDLVRSMGEWCE